MTLYPSKRNGMTLQDCFMQAVNYAAKHGMRLEGIEYDCRTGIYQFEFVSA